MRERRIRGRIRKRVGGEEENKNNILIVIILEGRPAFYWVGLIYCFLPFYYYFISL